MTLQTIEVSEAKFLCGSSSFKAFATDIVNGFNARHSTKIPPYEPIGSALGVSCFLSGVCSIAFSCSPLNVDEDSKANQLGKAPYKGKYTIPFSLSTFTFATKKASNVKLSASEVVSIYEGRLTAWSTISAGSSGTIVPVARLDDSCSTNVINTWLKIAGWKLVGKKSWKGKAGISPAVVYQTGTGAVVTYLKRNENAIGYVNTGLAIAGGLHQSAIRNLWGKYVLATNADPSQSIPRPLPKAAASWSGVTLVNKAGNGTFPIVTFDYAFVKICGGYLVKQFMLYMQSSAVQNLLNVKYDNQFFRLPAYVISQNFVAIKKIATMC